MTDDGPSPEGSRAVRRCSDEFPSAPRSTVQTVGAGEDAMKLLLTSGGVTNPTIEGALVGLLGRPIGECSALCIPTALYVSHVAF